MTPDSLSTDPFSVRDQPRACPAAPALPSLSTSGLPFLSSPDPAPHMARMTTILRAHPEVRDLYGRNPATAWWILAVAAFQFSLAALAGHLAWPWALPLAWVFGAFASHACYVLLHEAIHGLIFRRKSHNLIAAIAANLPTAIPSAIAFRSFHLAHHQQQGVHSEDADMPRGWELRLFDWGATGKALWLSTYAMIIILRSFAFPGIQIDRRWALANWVTVLAVNASVWLLFGPHALLYLLASTAFGLGLHPVGARWIQEHFVVTPPQETYSYYGPLNRLAFNVGYHNEHHDFPGISWNRLPELRRLARPFYDSLYAHPSWPGLLLRFLFDPNIRLLSRVERETRFGLIRRQEEGPPQACPTSSPIPSPEH